MGAVYLAWDHYRCCESGMISLRVPVPGMSSLRGPCRGNGFATGSLYLAWVHYGITTVVVYLAWDHYGCRVPGMESLQVQ